MIGSLPRFFRFGLVGCAGFCIDVGVLYAALNLLGLGHYAGRLLSYLVAASSTWHLNRRLTFADSRSDRRLTEWLRFVTLNGFGGVLNYGVYAAYIHFAPPSSFTPGIGVALGSLTGLCANYLMSSHFVFRSANPSIK